MRLPLRVVLHRGHEFVGDTDGEVGVLKQDAAVGFAVEVGFIAPLLNQAMGLLLFLPLAFDEFQNVRVPDFQRLHLGGPAGLAAALDHRGNLVVDPHERKRTGGFAAAREFLAVRAKRGKVRPRATAELEEHGLAGRQTHDGFHVVADALDKASRALRKLVGVLRLLDVHRFGVPAPVALAAGHAVLVEQADVEPHGGIERPVLIEA